MSNSHFYFLNLCFKIFNKSFTEQQDNISPRSNQSNSSLRSIEIDAAAINNNTSNYNIHEPLMETFISPTSSNHQKNSNHTLMHVETTTNHLATNNIAPLTNTTTTSSSSFTTDDSFSNNVSGAKSPRFTPRNPVTGFGIYTPSHLHRKMDSHRGILCENNFL